MYNSTFVDRLISDELAPTPFKWAGYPSDKSKVWVFQGARLKEMIKLDTILHINRASVTTYKMNSKCSSRGNVQTLIFSRNVHHKTQHTLYCLYRF